MKETTLKDMRVIDLVALAELLNGIDVKSSEYGISEFQMNLLIGGLKRLTLDNDERLRISAAFRDTAAVLINAAGLLPYAGDLDEAIETKDGHLVFTH